MGLVKFDRDEDNLVSGSYSTARGPVLRSDKIEVTKVFYDKGKGAGVHSHPEEQFFYVLKGRMEVTMGGETYVVEEGEGSFHPSNEPHAVLALEDVEALSFKNLVDPSRYAATSQLD